MKKTYIIPQIDVIELKYSGLLCGSGIDGDLGGIADEPGKARDFGWDDEDMDW